LTTTKLSKSLVDEVKEAAELVVVFLYEMSKASLELSSDLSLNESPKLDSLRLELGKSEYW
jgi:hypothetical protein